MTSAVSGGLYFEEVEHLGFAVEGGWGREIEAAGAKIPRKTRIGDQTVHIEHYIGADVVIPTRRYGVVF